MTNFSAAERDSLAADLKAAAVAEGFSAAGIAPAVAPGGYSALLDWIDRGRAGEMRYFEERRQAYAHPSFVLEGVRTLLVLAFPYRTVLPRPVGPGQGRLSRYGWGTDYHDLIRPKLKRLGTLLKRRVPGARCRGVVDTAPLLEREFARLAGLGWIGRHTLSISKTAGSWFFLAALLTDVDLPCDEPFDAFHCGTCRACLDACPTAAFPEPFVLDARRCISYLTIEHRGPIDRELRPGIGEWVLGCDVCQDVCPWNRKPDDVAPPELFPRQGHDPLDLAELFFLTDAEFLARFAGTPLARPQRRGILRNAAIVLGNRGEAAALPALARGVRDPEPLVRGACVWALARLDPPAGMDLLRSLRATETDPHVQEELAFALGEEPPSPA